MTKRGRTQGRYVRLKCAALNHSSFCHRPGIELSTISQLFETRPKSDGSYQKGKCGTNNSFHKSSGRVGRLSRPEPLRNSNQPCLTISSIIASGINGT